MAAWKHNGAMLAKGIEGHTTNANELFCQNCCQPCQSKLKGAQEQFENRSNIAKKKGNTKLLCLLFGVKPVRNRFIYTVLMQRE